MVRPGLSLGTVQWGMPYGVANRTGQPTLEECARILEMGLRAGVDHLDCARVYGQAEERVGHLLKCLAPAPPVTVVTKLDPLLQWGPQARPSELLAAVDESLKRSLRALQKDCLDVLLLHEWSQRWWAGGALWARLLEARRSGRIAKLGASVQSPEEAIEALEHPEVVYLQLPFNLLDWRWKRAGFPKQRKRRPELVVHVRSCLLQGLLACPQETWPAWARFGTGNLSAVACECQRLDAVDLCLAYVRAHDWVGSLVIGMETLAQLEANLRYFARPPLSPEQVELVESELAGAPAELLNPALWPRLKGTASAAEC